ncbi:hypothetical protein HN371_25075 [Candidatus Poribacteria bacterium]|jgi:hypothetical protein|nr:hypothetical protein [Candidatus Poribacteria bacterium]MBT5536405.1 hypothetical protein [Candidatus Poribacteria bacterium]MBT5714780.1 hypothetical protein [Candidatus Poribacteria bacterium]MBT7098012.1 hypothetical protein [Candidatus Poribacteria bacterium]MBT7809564.1 hypothetical protein [Candidatus Poribacteria bacterium]
MIHSLVIDATGQDLRRIRQGMAAIAELADNADVPITWALDVRSARSAASWLVERSNRPDTVILVLNTGTWGLSDTSAADANIDEAAERLVREREQLPTRIGQERDRLIEALPGAKVTIAGAEAKNPALIYALESLEFQGLWGYRWNEASPRAMDRGCPFGYFFVSRDRQHSGGAPASTVVGVPRHSGDLSFWRRMPPEPGVAPNAEDDILIGEPAPTPIVIDLDTATTTAELRRVAACGEVNAWNAVVQTIHAEECAALTEQDTADLNEVWAAAKEFGFTSTPLTESVAEYRTRFPETEPTIQVADRAAASEGPARPGGSREFFYYDARGQYTFDDGGSAPTDCYNYVTAPASSRFLTEYELPTVTDFSSERRRSQLRLSLALESPKPMPYAMFMWNEHRHLSVVEENVLELRWVDEHGMLILMDLEPGKNEFSVLLTI